MIPCPIVPARPVSAGLSRSATQEPYNLDIFLLLITQTTRARLGHHPRKAHSAALSIENVGNRKGVDHGRKLDSKKGKLYGGRLRPEATLRRSCDADVDIH
jgi:hypothetical protein